MRLVYENDNRTLIYSVKNKLELEGIDCHIKNEYASTTGGPDLGISNSLELWVINENDYDRALLTIEAQLANSANSGDWTCKQCGETNDASFESCWKCQTNHQAYA